MFGKIFKKIIFNRLYNIFLNERLLNTNPFGFFPTDSCVNQLFVVTQIFEAFDYNPSLEVRSVFLDISKTFNKIWHLGLLYKVKSMGIYGNFMIFLKTICLVDFKGLF